MQTARLKYTLLPVELLARFETAHEKTEKESKP